jgi:hypothetical protein
MVYKGAILKKNQDPAALADDFSLLSSQNLVDQV